MSDEFDDSEVPEKGAPLWMVTFGDLMSLLLCFFVLLLSFSEIDAQKYKELAGSMSKAFGVQKKRKVFKMPMGRGSLRGNTKEPIWPNGRRRNSAKK